MSPARRDACTAKAAQALRFQSRPDATRQYFSRLTRLDGRDLRLHMARHYEVLGENVSSVLLMLGGPQAERVSLGLNPDTAMVARMIEDRIQMGRSPIEIGDVASIQVEGEFLRLDFLPGSVAIGYVYVICTDFERRSLADQTFVDYTRGNGEIQKISISALIRLLAE